MTDQELGNHLRYLWRSLFSYSISRSKSGFHKCVLNDRIFTLKSYNHAQWFAVTTAQWAGAYATYDSKPTLPDNDGIVYIIIKHPNDMPAFERDLLFVRLAAEE